MAKILFALPRFHTNLWYAVRQLLADGHELRFLVNTTKGTSDYSLLKPVEMGRYPSRKEVADEIKAFAPDVMFVRNSWGLSRKASKVGRRYSIPTLLYNQTPVDVQTSIFRRFEQRFKGLPVERITPVRSPHWNGKKDSYAHYLPWPVGGALKAPPEPSKGDDKLKVLLVGKLGVARKNHVRLIQAISSSELPDYINLSIVGSPTRLESDYYQKLVKEADKSWIKLEGSKPFSEMPGVYQAHDVCILPSHGEPLGTSPVEAMAYQNVPVISNQCGSAGYLSHGLDGFIVDPDDLSTCVDVLRALASDRVLLQRMKTEAFHTFARDLSEEAFSRNFRDLLNRLGVK